MRRRSRAIALTNSIPFGSDPTISTPLTGTNSLRADEVME
jgi:hypothetical protein